MLRGRQKDSDILLNCSCVDIKFAAKAKEIKELNDQKNRAEHYWDAAQKGTMSCVLRPLLFVSVTTKRRDSITRFGSNERRKRGDAEQTPAGSVDFDALA